MPQIGWFEILVIVLLSILIIGPKDFPVVLRKIGNWTNSIKKYFNEIQRNVTDAKESIEDEISIEKNILKKFKDKEKDKDE
jgi:sec-independent protein translocase protein TatB